MSDITIRIDQDVYDAILAEKHAIERAERRHVSMNDALRSLLTKAAAWSRMQEITQKAIDAEAAAPTFHGSAAFEHLTPVAGFRDLKNPGDGL